MRQWCWRFVELVLGSTDWKPAVGKLTACRQSLPPWTPTLEKPEKQGENRMSTEDRFHSAVIGLRNACSVLQRITARVRYSPPIKCDWVTWLFCRLPPVTYIPSTCCGLSKHGPVQTRNWTSLTKPVQSLLVSHHSNNNSYSREDTRLPLFVREVWFQYSCHWVSFYCRC